MPRMRNTVSKRTLFPPIFKSFFKLRATEGLGFVLVISGIVLGLSLLSYDRTDPSWNVAVDAHIVRNFVGPFGAVLADLFQQLMGIAGWVLGPLLVVWGVRVLLHRPPTYPWLKLLILPSVLVLWAIFWTALPLPKEWGFLGGSLGYLGLELLKTIALYSTLAIGNLPLALISGILAVLLFLYILGVPWRLWKQILKHTGKSTNLIFKGFLFLVRKRPDGLRIQLRNVEESPEPLPLSKSAEPTLSEKKMVSRKTKEKVTLDRTDETALYKPLELVSDENYRLPPHDLLAKPKKDKGLKEESDDILEKKAASLENVLKDFGVRGEIVKVRPGPVVTLYELCPAPGLKSSRVIGLSSDIARSMSAVSARVSVVAGQNVIGIELPNQKRDVVMLREQLGHEAFERTAGRLALILGKDIGGEPIIVDLARMPHLLVAGTTGSGKSVSVNTMILSLLYRLPPDRCKFIMIDPKMLELSVYEDIPHLLTPVVTDPKKAVVALKWAVKEMENRYRAMSRLGVRNIDGYNLRLKEAKEREEVIKRKVQTGFDPETGKAIYEEQPLDMTPMPYIVIVVDEMADLMLVAGKDIEVVIQRLAQMARAAGIHLIMATQRPSVDVITGTIKANFPTRISFQVTSKIDSRTILGEAGAEQLLGQGDMLYMAAGGRVTRVHGPFVSDEEVDKVVAFLKTQGSPTYVEDVTEEDEEGGVSGESSRDHDPLYDQAVSIVCREQKASTSFVQRHLQIGYNRAARIVEQMEAEGVISAANHAGRREVLAGSQ